ncbi:MAG: biotin/lipoate A/B protein ligase family protein [Candidatus Thermoplasmatota archaeon]|jgi:lipoate-protein ligase A|nr:biotin/lipoate A/B protein ligase family protein [Candidatus Thermoplasmatota archaeon]
MKEQWRLLKTGFKNAFANMAIDEAVLINCSRGKVPPTVRFYGWSPPAISIGYFQSLEDEVDLDFCEKIGVDYVRRITGGGAVFHDKELTYSIVVPESHLSVPKNIMESYGRICGAIIRGLRFLGVESSYAPINDIVVDGRKISGNAQTRKMRTVLQHGTVLMGVDVEKMFSLLMVPNEKIRDKLISDVKQRVTSLEDVLGKNVVFDDVATAMKKGFEEEFDVELVEGNLTDSETALAEKIEKERFSSREWNHRR